MVAVLVAYVYCEVCAGAGYWAQVCYCADLCGGVYAARDKGCAGYAVADVDCFW